jgi:hypothetical protein
MILRIVERPIVIGIDVRFIIGSVVFGTATWRCVVRVVGIVRGVARANVLVSFVSFVILVVVLGSVRRCG